MDLYKKKIVKFFITFSLIVLAFSYIIILSNSRAANDSDDVYKQLNMFGEVYERVRREYVEEVSDKELIEAAIEGMLQSLDPHSSFFSRDPFTNKEI